MFGKQKGIDIINDCVNIYTDTKTKLKAGIETCQEENEVLEEKKRELEKEISANDSSIKTATSITKNIDKMLGTEVTEEVPQIEEEKDNDIT